MRTLSALSVALGAVVIAAPALSADIGTYVPSYDPVSYTSAAYDWNGFYAGVNAGYSWGEANLGLAGVDLNPGGFSGGGQVGFNMDMGGFVVGAETDIQLANVNDRQNTGTANFTSKVDYFGTLRGRIGMPLEGVLPYLTGGLAYGSNTTTSNANGPTTTDSMFHVGYAVGAGVEVAVTDAISVKGEYLFTALGEQTYNIAAPGGGTGVNNDVSFHTVRLGVNYAF